MNFKIRTATEADRDNLQQLICISACELSRAYYSDEQIAAALARVFGVDTALIEDRTYFVAEVGNTQVGCGGWSKRKSLFGGDQFHTRDARLLDPEIEPAKIRAFFVHPQYARRGIGRALLERCETGAKQHGFNSVELMSTLPGVPFYGACGYTAGRPIQYDAGGVLLGFIAMSKILGPEMRGRVVEGCD